MDIAGPKLKEFHTQKAAIEAEIAEAPEEEKIVGLHPAALREYGRHVEQLQSVFSNGVTQDLAEAAGKIQDLVARVTLIPQETGFKIELEGRLALLMQAPKLYPNMRIAASGGSVVAEGRYCLSPRQDPSVFMVRVVRRGFHGGRKLKRGA